jgi:hypothetical protein
MPEETPTPSLFYFNLHGDPLQELDLTGWPSALQRFGAVGLVAPLIYTPGEWSLQFMSHFFGAFLGGEAVGKALLDARRKLFEESGNPLGLLYVHFGLPDVHLSTDSEG